MLPMDPVAAALTRALSRQFSDAFITLDSQQGSPFNDSMTLHCTWRLRQPSVEAVAARRSSQLS
jgi:hypothetical protein